MYLRLRHLHTFSNCICAALIWSLLPTFSHGVGVERSYQPDVHSISSAAMRPELAATALSQVVVFCKFAALAGAIIAGAAIASRLQSNRSGHIAKMHSDDRVSLEDGLAFSDLDECCKSRARPAALTSKCITQAQGCTVRDSDDVADASEITPLLGCEPLEEAPSRKRRVSFHTKLSEVHEIVPYSEVYGVHPSTFDFDKRQSPPSWCFCGDAQDESDEDFFTFCNNDGLEHEREMAPMLEAYCCSARLPSIDKGSLDDEQDTQSPGSSEAGFDGSNASSASDEEEL